MGAGDRKRNRQLLLNEGRKCGELGCPSSATPPAVSGSSLPGSDLRKQKHQAQRNQNHKYLRNPGHCCREEVQETGAYVCQGQVQVSALSQLSSVTLGKTPPHSVPGLPPLYREKVKGSLVMCQLDRCGYVEVVPEKRMQ